MAEGRFWVSTGDIRQHYDVVNIVAAKMVGIFEPDYAKASGELIDHLSQSAMQIGANGVIWIQIIPVDKGAGMGYGLYATGTAVRVTSTEPVT